MERNVIRRTIASLIIDFKAGAFLEQAPVVNWFFIFPKEDEMNIEVCVKIGFQEGTKSLKFDDNFKEILNGGKRAIRKESGRIIKEVFPNYPGPCKTNQENVYMPEFAYNLQYFRDAKHVMKMLSIK